MGINLQKGQKIDLTKGGGTGLKKVMVGLGWDEAEQPRQSKGFLSSLFGGDSTPQSIDCDAAAVLCAEDGKMRELVYYGQLKSGNGSVVHQGDNLTGEGDGDDEQIMVDIPNLPSSIHKIVFVVNIYEAASRNQHFGMINNAFIRLVDMDKNTELCRFNLSENYNGMEGMIVGEIYRYNGEWKFNAIGQPVQKASRVQDLIEKI
ncbi:MAG: TerD family protein [Lachnospiraceae bacterium]|nr:TerD family protein [Lachnospiraceae bacterium]